MKVRRHRSTNNDAVVLLRYSLMALLFVLIPATLFLTAFSWYGSLEFHAMQDIDLVASTLFLKNQLIFGTIGLIVCLPFFILSAFINNKLKRVEYKWKKLVLVVSFVVATIVFLVFEIFSIVFMNYFYSWQLSLVLTFWPLIYVMLASLILVEYFNFYNHHKSYLHNQKLQEEDKAMQLRNQVDTIF